MREWKIYEMAYSTYFEKTIPSKVTDAYGHAWEWSEEDLVYWDEAENYVFFDSMILRLDEGGLVIREEFNENAR